MKRIAVVTGASRGIGEAIAKGLAERGLEVRGTSSKDLDLARDASIDAFVRTVPALDVLVNDAGIALDGFDADIARRTLDVNFAGAMRLTDRLLPALREGARIVMVSSGVGELARFGSEVRAELSSSTLDRARLVRLADRFVEEVRAGVHEKSGFPSSAYAVSKAALNAYVRLLARELAGDPRKILVNAACPGWVRTRMGGEHAPRSPEEGAKTPIHLALLPEGGPSGGFFRDEAPIPF